MSADVNRQGFAGVEFDIAMTVYIQAHILAFKFATFDFSVAVDIER